MKDNRSSRAFNLMAKPAGPLCNLRCDYCFYLDKINLFPNLKGKEHRMDSATLETYVLQYINAQPENCREIIFAWQGGEPTLLPLDFYKEVVDLQRKYTPPGVSIKNAFQSNGIRIDREWARFLAENQFLVGISLDGPEEIHNRYRKDEKGMGSFSRVMNGVEQLRAFQVDFNTLTVVQDHNSLYPEEVYSFLKKAGTSFMQFIPIVESLGHGKVSSRTVPAERWGSFLISLFRQWASEDMGRYFIQHFDLFLGMYMGYPANLCVHSRQCGDALVIEQDGSIFSCDHFVDEKHRLGRLGDQNLVDLVDDPRQKAFGKAKETTLPETCRECPYLHFCNGGCPKNRILTAEGGDLNWLCEGYKAFFSFSIPYFDAMAKALKNQQPADQFRTYLGVPNKKPGPNELCYCLSGKKYKKCCGN